MAHTTVTIEYSKAGTLPPIYLAGSFSDPAWQPQEMEYSITADGEHKFHKEVQVEEGKEYQYKFRIGEGDWWVLNEDSPTVTDDIGNRNNLLSVPKTQESATEMEHGKEILEAPALESKPPASTPDEIKAENPTLHMAQTHQHEDAQITPAVEPIGPASVGKSVTDKTEAEEIEELKEDLQNSSLPGEDANKEGETSKSNKIHPEFPVEPTPTPANDLATPFPETAMDQQEKTADAEMENEKSLPTLIVEKTDLAPNHGDDFGPDATSAQKHAHDTHALDAVPDYVLLRNQSHTPDFVTTASEVADVAATLDREAPTPPISDEEAGRIGLRRLSHTPIPEVAATAAEVADVAASFDGNFLPLIIEPPAFDTNKESFNDSGRSTPANEKVPKFSHECCELPDHVEPCHHEPIEPLPEERSSYEDSAEEIDLNDPSIQMFPTEANEIFAKLREIQKRLPEDETRNDGIPPSPVVGPSHRPNSNGQLHTPLPGFRAPERSLSLHSISEEVERGVFFSLTDETKTNGRALKSLNGLEKPVVNGNHDTSDVQEPTTTQEEAALSEEQPVSHKEHPVSSQEPAVLSREKPTTSENQPLVAQENHETPLPKNTDNEPVRNLEDTSQPQIPQKHKVSLMSDGSVDDNVTMKLAEEQHRVEVQEVHPETTPSRSATRSPNPDLRLGGLAQNPVPAVTPFVAGNRQLGHDEGLQNIGTGNGPSITIVPATPGGSTTNLTDKKPVLDDTAKTTAVQNDQAEAKHRKQHIPERPLTPSSMRSAGKEAKNRNFLKAFWRVIFVDWIGGLIMRLCGGIRGRQKTLLAVIGVAGFAVAPTLYFSDPAREVALQVWNAVSDTTTKYWQNWRSGFERWLQS